MQRSRLHDICDQAVGGVGGVSLHPAGGYDKKTQAGDMRTVLTQLGLGRAAVVGHDIGTKVAYAYVARYPGEAKKLLIMDAPAPGIPFWACSGTSISAARNAERLVAGREHLPRPVCNEFAGDPTNHSGLSQSCWISWR
jgi:pimeloyl-ACP methyl ester carboxylesterase